ncbi:MAG TPA: SusC/RagA family TonB-linked outer membrane protein [Bacteroidales bacterium]|nr:SusC/RagA family TonB-linked outer membrane protein [Bacteroidales bacterium]
MIRKKVYQILMRTLFMLICVAFSHSLLAQQRVVSGSVRDVSGAGLPGVSILVKGTTVGTTTDAQGRYSIAAAGDATLQFSFIGYVTQEVAVGNRSVIDMILEEDIQQLGEVVVTALGIERSQKALQSTITKVPGMSLTQARENNLGSSIQGRVAGVNVSSTGAGPAGSSRVIIRGNKSVGSNNQPLYVIDGIPMDNTQFGRAGVWGGTDQGDGMTSLNPEDIESVTVLKGAAAAALYGSRGGYGVINIVTKRGQARKGVGIEFNSNYVFEHYLNFSDLQREYGPGGLANADPNDPNSPRVYSKPISQEQAYGWGSGSMWGPKLDGTPVVQFDGVLRPYSYAGDNWKRFYQTGHIWTNSLALSGGSEKQTFRFSFSDMDNKAIIPNETFKRRNLSLSTNGKYGERLTFNAKVMYSNEKVNNRQMISDSPGNAPQAIWSLPNTLNVNDLKGDPNKPGAVAPGVTTPDLKSVGEEFQPADNNWLQNPWWVAYQFKNENIRDRFITSGTLRYNILKWWWVQGQIGMDWYTRNNNSLVPQGTGYQRGGFKTENSNFVREINMEWMSGVDKEFGKFRLNAFVGGNQMKRESESISASGENFNIPFYTSVTNTRSQNIGYGYGKSGVNSLFGSAEVSFNNYLFITATARNDWFSVLNPANNSKLYPSLGGSFVFTDAFKNLPEVLSYGKVRAAWGQVATANVGAYSSRITYGLVGQGHLGLPMAGFSGGDNIPNPNLSPALSTELEFGADLRFFQGRLGLEFTYYNQKTTDDILSASISRTSGFLTTSVNIGELSNKGIELLITATPVQGPVTWDVSLNLAKNKNKVIQLSEGVTEINVEEPRTRTVYIKHIVGYPFGMITGYRQKTDDHGNLVYESNGSPVRSDVYEILGNGVADWTGGLNNSITWKRIRLDALIDFKFGGDIYSGTNVRLTQWGLHKQTLVDREGGKVVKGVTQTGTDANGKPIYEDFTLTLDQEQTRQYWGNLGERAQENFIYDASFIKLRQVSLEYSLPVKLLTKTPFTNLAVSFVGRNLAILFKNIENVDPESNYTDSNAQGLDYFGMPTTRTYGFNLRVTF